MGRSRRATYQTPRRRKFSPEQEAAIATEAQHRSLRDLAAEHDISPELVRLIIRRAPPAPLAPVPESA